MFKEKWGTKTPARIRRGKVWNPSRIRGNCMDEEGKEWNPCMKKREKYGIPA
jgi:hypothetical protein